MMPRLSDNSPIRQSNEGVLLSLHVHPGAKRNALNGVFGDSMKLDLKAPPVDGKANTALLKLLSEWLELPKSVLEIKQGIASRNKLMLIRGGNIESIKKILGEHNE